MLFLYLQNIAIGVAAVLGGLVLYKVIKNDDSVSFHLPVLQNIPGVPMNWQDFCRAVILRHQNKPSC